MAETHGNAESGAAQEPLIKAALNQLQWNLESICDETTLPKRLLSERLIRHLSTVYALSTTNEAPYDDSKLVAWKERHCKTCKTDHTSLVVKEPYGETFTNMIQYLDNHITPDALKRCKDNVLPCYQKGNQKSLSELISPFIYGDGSAQWEFISYIYKEKLVTTEVMNTFLDM